MVITLSNTKTSNSPLCRKCKTKLEQRVPRGYLFKSILFWLPVKRYLCFKCNKKVYVWGN